MANCGLMPSAARKSAAGELVRAWCLFRRSARLFKVLQSQRLACAPELVKAGRANGRALPEAHM